MKWPACLTITLLIAWLATSFYVVQPDEQVVVLRCGRIDGLPREPGPHWGLPWGVDRVLRVKPREVKRVAIGTATTNDGATSAPWLTGDRNLVHVRASVQYAINDSAHYLTATADPERLIATSAAAVLANLLAGEGVDRLLTLGKRELAVRAAENLQTRIDTYGLGVLVRSVDLAAVEPPAEVADAFDRVVQAQRQREQTIHQAQSFAHRTLAESQGEAQQQIDQARAEHDRLVLRARGEADRFERLLAEYQHDPALTGTRLYLQAMAEVLPKLRSKLIVDSGQGLDLSIFEEQKR